MTKAAEKEAEKAWDVADCFKKRAEAAEKRANMLSDECDRLQREIVESSVDLIKSAASKANLATENAMLRRELDEAREVVEDLTGQFAYEVNDPPGLTHGGLSALEDAFRCLGWDNPHPTPQRQCDEPGCGKHAACGWPSPAGYRRTCGDHTQRGDR